MSRRELYCFYDDHLKRFGIDESVICCEQLTSGQRLDAATQGIGLTLLSIWITGRNRAAMPEHIT